MLVNRLHWIFEKLEKIKSAAGWERKKKVAFPTTPHSGECSRRFERDMLLKLVLGVKSSGWGGVLS